MSDDFDAFTMDDIDPDKPGSAGGGMLPEGGYKLLIVGVTLKNERGSTHVECEVTDAKDKSLIGRKHNEFLSWPDGVHSAQYNQIKKEQLLSWCYAAKTTCAEEIKARQQARQGFNSDWLEMMVGQQVLAVVKHATYTNQSGDEKTSANIEGRVWALDNPKGKGIPGYIPTAPTGSGPMATAAASGGQQPQGGGQFDDLV